MKAQYTSDRRYRIQHRGRLFFLQHPDRNIKAGGKLTDHWVDHGGVWDDHKSALTALQQREPRP